MHRTQVLYTITVVLWDMPRYDDKRCFSLPNKELSLPFHKIPHNQGYMWCLKCYISTRICNHICKVQLLPRKINRRINVFFSRVMLIHDHVLSKFIWCRCVGSYIPKIIQVSWCAIPNVDVMRAKIKTIGNSIEKYMAKTVGAGISSFKTQFSMGSGFESLTPTFTQTFMSSLKQRKTFMNFAERISFPMIFHRAAQLTVSKAFF